MRKKARIVGLISRLNEKKQRVRIPKGECEIDEGPDGIGPYVLYWKEDGRELGAELTLVEFAITLAENCGSKANHVDPGVNSSRRDRDRVMAIVSEVTT